jgi:hypothetical protein
MADQRPHFARRRFRREHDRRPLAGFARDAPSLVLAQPFSLGDETRQRLRQLGDQNLARGNGKIVTRQR